MAALGRVPRDDLERTLNMGVGFVALVPAEHVDEALAVAREHGLGGWVAGTVHADEDAPHLGESRPSAAPRASTVARCASWASTPRLNEHDHPRRAGVYLPTRRSPRVRAHDPRCG